MKFLKILFLILILNLPCCALTTYVKEDLKFNKPSSEQSLNNNVTHNYNIECIYLNGASDNYFDIRYSFIFDQYRDINFSRGDKNLIKEKALIDKAMKYFINKKFFEIRNKNLKYFFNITVKIDRDYPLYKSFGNSVLTGLTLLLYPGQTDNYRVETQIELFEYNNLTNNRKLINTFSYQRNLVERVGLFSMFNNLKYWSSSIEQTYIESRNQSLENAINDMLYDFSNDLKK